jgi:hypothetical protein
MPDEPLEDSNTGLKYNAYLAEVRSIGGLSGSPVFALVENLQAKLKVSAFPEWKYRKHLLLGLIRGHWDYKNQQSSIDCAGDELGAVNMGIAIVTPVQEVQALLYSDELVKYRRRKDKEHVNKK